MIPVDDAHIDQGSANLMGEDIRLPFDLPAARIPDSRTSRISQASLTDKSKKKVRTGLPSAVPRQCVVPGSFLKSPESALYADRAPFATGAGPVGRLERFAVFSLQITAENSGARVLRPVHPGGGARHLFFPCINRWNRADERDRHAPKRVCCRAHDHRSSAMTYPSHLIPT